MLMAAAGKLPPEQVSLLLGTLPQQELDGIAVQLLAEKEDNILELCSRCLEKQALPFSVTSLSLNKNMELSVVLTQIDYAALARRFLPLIPAAVLSGHPATKVLVALLKLPSQLLYSALEAIPPEKLESAAIYLLNHYEAVILSKLCAVFEAHGITLNPTGLRAEH